MSERLTGVPEFEHARQVWRCWTLGEGGAAVMVWRAGDRLECRHVIEFEPDLAAIAAAEAAGDAATLANPPQKAVKRWVAYVDGRPVGVPQATLRLAMARAADEARRQAA